MVKYLSFVGAGLPSWILGIIFISYTTGAIPFFVQSATFIVLSVHLNYFVVRKFVFKGSERGRNYFLFLSSVMIFRIIEYFCSLLLFTFTNVPLFSLLAANLAISILKFRYLKSNVKLVN